MNEGWVKIYTSSDFYKSEIVRQVLVEHDIKAVLLNKKGYPYNLGEVEVYIQPDRFQQALELIIENNL